MSGRGKGEERERRRADQVVLVSSSRSVAFIVCCAKAVTTRGELVPERRSICSQSWSIWRPRFSSLLATLLVTTRRHHSTSPSAGHRQRRGTEQAAVGRHDRSWWCSAQHLGCSATQEVAEGQQVDDLTDFCLPQPALFRATHILHEENCTACSVRSRIGDQRRLTYN